MWLLPPGGSQLARARWCVGDHGEFDGGPLRDANLDAFEGLDVTAMKSDRGSLRVEFGSGAVLEVEALRDADAWSLDLPDGRTFYSFPGGELVLFRPTCRFENFVDWVLRQFGR